MDLEAIIAQAIELLVKGGAPLWAVIALAIGAAIVLKVAPKIRITLPKPTPAPVVDEGGVQHEGTPLPNDPNRDDLDYGGSG